MSDEDRPTTAEERAKMLSEMKRELGRCGAMWNAYECVRPVGHDGRHATEKNLTTWHDDACTSRSAEQAAHQEHGVQFDHANHCVRCGHVLLNCRCDSVSVARLEAIVANRVITGAADAQSMARELLKVRAERTNEAHRAQLEEAKASVARSLTTQFRAKVFSIRLNSDTSGGIYPGEYSEVDKLESFFKDLASNAVAGLTDLIARESDSEE